MSGRKPGRGGGAGAAAGPPPPPTARQQCTLKTLTLDGSLFDAPAAGRPVGGSPKRQVGQGSAHAGSGSKPRARPGPRPAGGVLLDNGEAEAAFIDTLRTHYTRNGTGECFAPKFSKSPTKAYSRNSRAGGGAVDDAPSGGLVQQERALWEEREEELVDAQERRFAQLEDALAARESKREAYLVHRLEATAARKIEEHRRVQEAAARARELAVQRVQQLPSLQKARAAAQPPSPTAAALQKLARRPPCPASPGLAAVQQAVGGVSSLGVLSTQGLESGLGAAAPPAGAPLLCAGRLTWEAKRQAAAAQCVDQVFDQIQAAKATGSPLLSPLDAAKDAIRMSPAGGRSGSRASACLAAATESLAGGAVSASEDGSEGLGEAEGLPHSRRSRSLGSGVSLSAGGPAGEEAAGGKAAFSLDTASPGCQPLAATDPVSADEPAGELVATGSEEGGVEEAAPPLPVAGSSRRGSSEALELPEEQRPVEMASEEVPSDGQPGDISSQPSTAEPEEDSSGCGSLLAVAGGDAAEEGGLAAQDLQAEEPVTDTMLAAEATAAEAPAAEAVAGGAPAAAAETAAVAEAAEVAEVPAGQAGLLLLTAEADAGAKPPAEPAQKPADELPVGADDSSPATATEAECGTTAAEQAAALEAAVPACQQEMGGAVMEQGLACSGTAVELPAAEPAVQAALPIAAPEGLPSPAAAAAGGPTEVPAAGGGQPQEVASVTEDEAGAADEQQPVCAQPEGPNGPSEGISLLEEAAAAAAEGAPVPEQAQLEEQAPVAAAAEPAQEQQAASAPAPGPDEAAALQEDVAGCEVAAATEGSFSEAAPCVGSPAEPLVEAAAEACATLAGPISEQRGAGMAAADSAEALALTQRASASLLFGGRSADGPDDGGGSGRPEGALEAAGAEAGMLTAEGVAAQGGDLAAEPAGST